MVTISAFASPKYQIDFYGRFSGYKVFEKWLKDPEANSLEKVHRVALLLPKDDRVNYRSVKEYTSISWLKDPRVPLLAKVGLVSTAAIVAAAACFAIAMVRPSLALYWGTLCLLGGTAALFADFCKPTMAQIEEKRQQQIAQWAEVVEAIGGVEKYYQIPVICMSNYRGREWPPSPQNPIFTQSIVKGMDLLSRPFILFKLQNKEDKKPFSLALTQDENTLCHISHENAYFKKWSEISQAPIPQKDKQRYQVELPKESPETSPNFFPPHTTIKEILQMLTSIVKKDHPQFELA